MSTLTKREFLKLMGGLGLGLIPFIGCYNTAETKQNEAVKDNDSTEDKPNNEAISVTDDDVILLQRDDAQFAAFNVSYNKRIQHLPKYIAVCKTEKGVQFAIQKAKSENLPVCIKSGGHSFEGFSSNDGGMVINLSQMKKITWHDNGEVSLAPGLLLRDLHQQVYQKGKLIPAGSCGGVGIAGLTLGGGYGFFSRKYGLTCDSLVGGKMIAADGKIIAFENEPKLLWALKGGGNGNFGVVTELRFKTYPLAPTFSSYTLRQKNLDTSTFKTLLAKWFEISNRLPKEAFSAFVLNGTSLTVLCTTYGNQNIEPIISGLENGANVFTKSLNKPLVPALKRFYGRAEPLYFKNASCGYFNAFKDLESAADAIFEEVVAQRGIIFQINTLGGAIADAGFEKASCYPHRSMNYLCELQAYYDQPSQEKNMLKGFNAIQSILSKAGVDKHYRNYPDINFQNWQDAYYGANYAALQALKKQYDPENLFRYPQSVEV